jgi:hypothetical protein
MKRALTLTAAFSILTALPAAANEYEPALRAFLESELLGWASDPALVSEVQAQNDANSGLTQADIDMRDASWRAEVGQAATPTITPVLESAASAILRARVEASGGTVTEAFVMDRFGMNVGASAVTSDFWQGDEDKFTMTFGKGAGSVHIGEVEFDESTQSYQAQVSVTISDAETGMPVGALTVAVNAESLL